MRVKTPQVAWHGREEAGGKNDPILSLDVHHTLTLATAGTDNCIRIWRLKPNGLDLFDEVEPHENPLPATSSARPRPSELTRMGPTTTTRALYNFAFALVGHERPVNVVRFSPNGECLASAGDDARVVLWRRNDTITSEGWSWAQAESEREVQYKIFKGHLDDVYDLQWSPDGRFLISGSIDNCAIVWDVRTGKCLQRIKEHAGYVQGVAWDPLNQFIATQSSDRTCRIYSSAQNSRGEIFGSQHAGKWTPVKCRKTIKQRTACQIPQPASRSKTRKEKEADAAKADAAKADAAKADAAKVDASKTQTEAAKADSTESNSNTDKNGKTKAGSAPTSTKEDDAEAASANAEKPSTSEKQSGSSAKEDIPTNSATTAAANSKDNQKSGNSAGGNTNPSSPRSPDTSLSHVMFMDETVPNFFRRLCFSPDGEFLFTPTGCFKSLDGDADVVPGSRLPHKVPAVISKFVPTTYMFARGQWTNPAFHFPGSEDASIAVRCCPKIMAVRAETKHSVPRVTQAAYRVVFAIATQTEVLVYDTQHWYPICRFKDLHYAPISDIAWSPCGRLLCMSSQDGYITFVRFNDGELGSPPSQDVLPVILRDTHSFPPIFGAAEATVVSTFDSESPGAEGAGSSKASTEQTAATDGSGKSPRIAPTPLSSDEVVELTVKRKSSGGLVSTAGAETHTATAGKGSADTATSGDDQPKKRVRIAPIPVEGPVEATLP